MSRQTHTQHNIVDTMTHIFGSSARQVAQVRLGELVSAQVFGLHGGRRVDLVDDGVELVARLGLDAHANVGHRVRRRVHTIRELGDVARV